MTEHRLMTDDELLTRDPNNTKLTENKPIEGTPFHATRFGEDWYLTLGKFRITKEMETEQDCITASTDLSWERLMTIMMIMIRECDEVKDLQRQVQQITEIITKG